MKKIQQNVVVSVFTSNRSKGAALVTSLIFLTVMSVLGISSAKNNVAQERMANSYRYGVDSLNAAETGITDAIAEINEDDLFADADGYNNELGGNFMRTITDPDTGLVYQVIMIDDDDGDGDLTTDVNDIVLLLAQGTGPNSSVRTIEVAIDKPVITTGTFALDKAVLTGEDLVVNGNPSMAGLLQDIHSNGNVDLIGSTETSGLVSAVGTVSGQPKTGGGTTESNAAIIDIPDINPADYEQYMDYIFQSDGVVTDVAGNKVADGTDKNGALGWKFSGTSWTIDGNGNFTPPGGDLYFKGENGNVDIAGNPGAKGAWEVSIFADGYIDMSGNPTIINYADPNDPIEFQNLLLMSYEDIKIRGTYEQPADSLQGIIAAREQISIAGTPDIRGAVIAQGAASDGGLVTSNNISGNSTITFDGLETPFEVDDSGSVVVERLYWRQHRMAKGSAPFDAFIP